MRPFTIFVSVVAHLAAAAAIVTVSLTANDALPAVRRAIDFIEVRPVAPPPSPRPVPTKRVIPPTVNTFPIDAPSGIHDEHPVEPPEATASSDDLVVPDSIGVPSPVVVEAPPAATIREPLRVGGAIQPPHKIADVVPVYPPIARAAHVEGIVILEAVIGEDGRVRGVRPLKSIRLLDEAAMDAVREWRFTPTLLNGEPVSVVMTVTVAFYLR